MLFPLQVQELKPRGSKLWVQLDATCTAPHRGVALQVAFERQFLKPVFHLIGFRLWV
jgi:hypothetical protein